jgi:hypothetical protein
MQHGLHDEAVISGIVGSKECFAQQVPPYLEDDNVKILDQWKGESPDYVPAQRLVIRNKEPWEAAQLTANGSLSPQPKLPEVDFDKHMLLAVFMGTINTDGYATEITKIVTIGGEFEVFIRNTSPAPCELSLRLSRHRTTWCWYRGHQARSRSSMKYRLNSIGLARGSDLRAEGGRSSFSSRLP